MPNKLKGTGVSLLLLQLYKPANDGQIAKVFM
jgi:hypothetical protein